MLTNCAVRDLFPLELDTRFVSMLSGKPNDSTFPFTSLSMTTRSPFDPSKEMPINLTGEDLAFGLQYGPTAANPGLVNWIHGLQEKVHGRKQGEGWRSTIGGGSQDLIYKVRFMPQTQSTTREITEC